MPYKDPEDRKQQGKIYYLKNREKILKRSKEHQEKNKEKIKQYKKQRYMINREKILKEREKYYQENKDYILEQHKQYKKDRIEQHREYKRQDYRKRKKWLNGYKILKGCSICGYNRSPAALEFHHNGGKEFTIGECSSYGLKRIKKEIAKCIILCSNCHRELHEKKRKKTIMKEGINAKSKTQ